MQSGKPSMLVSNAAGAERIAVVRAIGDAPDPERAAAALRVILPC